MAVITPRIPRGDPGVINFKSGYEEDNRFLIAAFCNEGLVGLLRGQ
jgi:hypothetical protein